jgi:hypothetical protein
LHASVRTRAAARDFRFGPGRELTPPGKEEEMSKLHLSMTVIVATGQKREVSE